jgi:small subunit ribosomal protein S8e
MVQSHGRARRLKTGKIIKPARDKKKRELGRNAIETKIGVERKKIIRTRGGNSKTKLFAMDFVNVLDPKSNTTKRVSIKELEINHASIDYSRRSIITKGAILQTELGYVRVTSRPGQDGAVNGIIIDYKTE